MTKQLPLPLDSSHRANEISKRASKQRRQARKHLPVIQPSLPVPDSRFAPLPGVPRTRGDCPTKRPCPHIMCRHHLLLETSDTRAGRPSLASVPRDHRGLTLATPGSIGTARAPDTLRPAWLHVRGLEIERECRVFISRDDDGSIVLNEARDGALDYWLHHLLANEPVLVFDDDTATMVARARLTAAGTLAFDRELPAEAFMVVLTRVREVSSCALDLIDAHGKLTNELAGAAIARHRTLTARIVKKALGKAIENGKAMGVSASDLHRVLVDWDADA